MLQRSHVNATGILLYLLSTRVEESSQPVESTIGPFVVTSWFHGIGWRGVGSRLYSWVTPVPAFCLYGFEGFADHADQFQHMASDRGDSLYSSYAIGLTAVSTAGWSSSLRFYRPGRERANSRHADIETRVAPIVVPVFSNAVDLLLRRAPQHR